MDLSRLRERAATPVTDTTREAAVLVPVIDRNGTAHLLFTKRADHLEQHPGQMSFPGGGREPSDRSLLSTALREANEEVGLTADEAEVVGELDEIRTVTESEYAIRPFAASVSDRQYSPDPDEVAEIVVLPVSALTDLANYESERRNHPVYGDHRIHFFTVDGYTVWGATGQMLVQLLELTTDWRAPETVDRVVDPDADLPV